MPPEQLAEDPPIARGAVAVIVNSDGLLLMHLRDNIDGIVWPGYWSVLGGGCDPGEDPDQAIVRELQEEAGLVVPDLRPVLEIADATGSGQLLSVYLGQWDGNPATLNLTEGQELRWVAPLTLSSLRIPPHIRTVLYDPALSVVPPP